MDLYTLTLPLDTSAGATLRGWLGTILEENPMDRASAQEIILAAAEAVNNAVRHSAPEETTLIVTMSIVGRDVYLRVSDRERGVIPVPEADDLSDSESRLDDTLGLTLMQGLMDEVDLHHADDGTTVRLVKRLRLPSREESAGPPLGTAAALQTLRAG